MGSEMCIMVSTLDADNRLIPSPGSQGTSWLELFVLFELMGGKLVDNNHVDTPSLSKAVAAKTLLVDLLFFKKIFMFIVDTCIGGGERCFLRPPNHNGAVAKRSPFPTSSPVLIQPLSSLRFFSSGCCTLF